MSNFYIDLETGNCFIFERTLETEYMQGRFGAIPYIPEVKVRAQYTHTPMKIEDPKKLAKALKDMAKVLETRE